MNRLLQGSLCSVLLTGCTSLPTPSPPESEVPAGAPWGLAWIPPSGEVAIRAGAIEHVLYPQARAEKRVGAPLNPNSDADFAQRGPLSHLPSGTATPPHARSDRACEVGHGTVRGQFLAHQPVTDRALTVSKPRDACVVRPRR